MPAKKETRSIGELRAVNDDGTFEGYLTVWETVDDWNSTFKRGSFKKTIQERGSKVKIFFDHEHLIGSSLELREDDHGVFGRGKLNLAVDKAKEAYEFMKDGTLDGLSFGFRSIKEGFSNGVREIREVQLFEFGPVTFPANDAALITDVRSTAFSESLFDEELCSERDNLRYALKSTLSDIWWSNESTKDNVIGMLDKALSDHHAAYLEFANKWIERYWSDETRSAPFGNELSNAFNDFLMEQRKTVNDLAMETSFTQAELSELRQGNLIENRNSLETLSETISLAHRSQRNKAVETLCSELRDGLSDSEKKRVLALLKPVEQRQSEPDTITEIIDYFKNEQTIGEK